MVSYHTTTVSNIFTILRNLTEGRFISNVHYIFKTVQFIAIFLGKFGESSIIELTFSMQRNRAPSTVLPNPSIRLFY